MIVRNGNTVRDEDSERGWKKEAQGGKETKSSRSLNSVLDSARRERGEGALEVCRSSVSSSSARSIHDPITELFVATEKHR